MPASAVRARQVALSAALALGASPSQVPVTWVPPNLLGDSVPSRQATRLPVMSVRVGALGIVLENTSLAGVQQRLGGAVGHQGDAGESLSWLCLKGRDAAGAWVLWLEASEISGDYIAGFQLRRVATQARVDARCADLGATSVRITPDLRLGSRRDDVVALLGPVSGVRADTLVWGRLVSRHAPPPASATTLSTLSSVAVVLKNGRVDAVEAWRVTTN